MSVRAFMIAGAIAVIAAPAGAAGLDIGVSKDPFVTGGFDISKVGNGSAAAANTAMPNDVSASQTDMTANNNFTAHSFSDMPGWQSTVGQGGTLGAHN